MARHRKILAHPGVGLLLLILFFGISLLATKGARALLQPRIRPRLLRRVIARGIGIFVFLIGIYIVLRLSGLTQLALTIIGGTGLAGLAFGIAFRDITENFLASVFLSIQRPFETGDLIEVEGITGYVQQLNVRTTIVMTLAGNLVQIPNATLYKSNLQNFTANDNRREDFVVGIGYDDAIHQAQRTAQQVLIDHPAVLDDPEPSVLVDSLGTATVNLRIYFWINGREHSWLKVRSSVIRLVKLAFQQQAISMPDEAREVVFPRGVPVTMTGDKPTAEKKRALPEKRPTTKLPAEEIHAASTQAEGGFSSEADVIDGQARQAKPLKEAANLLPDAGAGAAADPAES